MPVIKDASFENLPAILDLQKVCYRENALRYDNQCIQPLTQTLDDIEREFRNGVFLKAVEGERIVGSIRACRRDSTCFIVRLFVHPEHQNRGIGKSLIGAIEQRFPDVDRYELFTGYKDEKNLHLYIALGYRQFKVEQRHDGMIFHFMQKLREDGGADKAAGYHA